MNLYQRINEVRKSIDYIQKDKSVSTGGSSYKAVTHDQVTAMVRDHMVKHGIVSYPILVESKSNPKEGDAKQFRYEATYDIVFVNADEPSDKLCIRIQAHAMDNADKACGKALSYAKKYAILKLFEIETGEDEESRYQSFDVNDWIDAIKTAKDLPELQQVYNDATNAALGAKDQNARRLIVAEKDKRKAELA
jgi:hypothetical protein